MEDVKVKWVPSRIVEVRDSSAVSAAQGAARAMAEALGFEARATEELAIAVSELATNLIKHAQGGTLTLTSLEQPGRLGFQIESLDRGPGIGDLELAMQDGFSTAGGPGYGLGAVNRLMDELEIGQRAATESGTRVLCRRWLRDHPASSGDCPLEVGVATRPHPGMAVNGDSFVVQHWDECLLVGIIDGLGHGPFAHRAAQAARHWIERHYDQPMEGIFRGVARACSATRGVVMALARFDWAPAELTFASVGNVEAHVLGNSQPVQLLVRRGVLGLRAVSPVITRHSWHPSYVLVLHSDGLTSHWRREDFPQLMSAPAGVASDALLRALARDNDDATVMVVRSRSSAGPEAGAGDSHRRRGPDAARGEI